MKERYTIGEVAALLNMSPQTLRFYDKSGVVVPHATDRKTGYRYYSYDQICYIDRVKYLQRFGFRLEDIRDALQGNDVGALKKLLSQQRTVLQDEADRLKALLEELDWYLDYYHHVDYQNFDNLPFKSKEPERYLLAEPLLPGEPIYGTAGLRLTKLQHSALFAQAQFLRCHAYLLDFDSLLNGQVVPTHYCIYLGHLPPFDHPQLKQIPAGTYLCTQARILAEPFDSACLQQYFKNRRPPGLVLATEYEDNFTGFRDCVYEVQILM